MIIPLFLGKILDQLDYIYKLGDLEFPLNDALYVWTALGNQQYLGAMNFLTILS